MSWTVAIALLLYAGLFDKMADSDLKDDGEIVISGKSCYLIAFQSIVSLIQKDLLAWEEGPTNPKITQEIIDRMSVYQGE